MTVPTAPIVFRAGRLPNSGKPRVRITATHKPPAYTPPATLDRFSAIPAASIGMDGNDKVGDCTCADGDHEIKAAQVAAGNTEVSSTEAEVLAAYSAITGYDPSQTQPDGSNPTDNGAEMQDVRSYWQKTGFKLGGQTHKVLLFAEVDIRDVTVAQWALDQFGAVGVGVNLPNSAMDQFNAGQPWDVVSDDGGIDGGHAIALVGYDTTGPVFLTWGQVQRATWAWWARYVEEAWTVLTEDFVNAHSGQDPLAATLYQMGQQFASLTGKPNPVPAPTPTPTPEPTPVPAPTPAPDVHVDAADEALMAALAEWDGERHVGDNHRAESAYNVWLAAKNAA